MRTVHIAPVAQVRLARVIPSMHVHLCVALWLISPRLSPSSTSFHRSPSSPSRCSPQCSTRSLGPTPCATSAWGPWPLLTTRHPSHIKTALVGNLIVMSLMSAAQFPRLSVQVATVKHQGRKHCERFQSRGVWLASLVQYRNHPPTPARVPLA